MYGDSSKDALFDRQKRALGRNIKKRRKYLNLSQEDLGLRLGADQAYVSRLESGHLNPTLVSLVELSISLEISLSMLMKNTSE